MWCYTERNIFRRVKGFAGITQVMATSGAEQVFAQEGGVQQPSERPGSPKVSARGVVDIPQESKGQSDASPAPRRGTRGKLRLKSYQQFSENLWEKLLRRILRRTSAQKNAETVRRIRSGICNEFIDNLKGKGRLVKAEIIHSLTNYFQSTYNTVLKPDENIFQSGIIDSLGFVALVTFLEENFNASLEPEDLIEDNFDSLETIANLISGKKA